MQTLDLSGTAPKSENRLKTLFWPTIQMPADVDNLGSQGFWICAIVATLSAVALIVGGQPISAFFGFLFYFLGGVGVREHSIFAAVVVFIMLVAGAVISPGILVFFGCVLLLANVRATFIASFWEPGSAEAEMPMRFNETWGDKLADSLPAWLWPKIRIAYVIFSTCFLALVMVGLYTIALRRHG